MSLIIAGLASQWTAAGGGGPTSGTLVPTSDVSISPTGMQGSYLDLDDDPGSSDSNWLLRPSARSTAFTDCTFGMSAPGGTPGGTDAQTLRVQVRARDRDGGTGNTEVATFRLEVDGTIVAQNLTTAVSLPTVESHAFDDSIVTSWSNVEVRLVMTSNGGGGPGGRAYVEIGAIAVDWSET